MATNGQTGNQAIQAARSHWKMDLFYFNPDDRRIMPSSRLSMLGWTVNWANPLSILAFAGLVVCIEMTLCAVWT